MCWSRDTVARFECVTRHPPSCATESDNGTSHDQKSQVPQGQTEIPRESGQEEDGEGSGKAHDPRRGEEAEGREEAGAQTGEGGGEEEAGAEEGPGAQAGGGEARRASADAARPRASTACSGTSAARAGTSAACASADAPAGPGRADAGRAVGRIVLRDAGNAAVVLERELRTDRLPGGAAPAAPSAPPR